MPTPKVACEPNASRSVASVAWREERETLLMGFYSIEEQQRNVCVCASYRSRQANLPRGEP